MTLQEAVYNILNSMVGGRSTNNEYISPRQIRFNILHYRSLLSRRETDRLGGNYGSSGGGQGGSHNSGTSFEELVQTITVPFSTTVYPTDTPIVHIPNLVIDNEFISDDIIPRYVRLRGRSGIIRVAYQTIGIPMIHTNESPWRKYNKFTSDRPYVFIREDGKMLLGEFTLTTAPFSLSVTGVFEDPELAYNFGGTTPAWDDDTNEFPLPLDMYQRIMDGLLNGTFKFIIDTSNDTELNTLPDQQLARSGA